MYACGLAVEVSVLSGTDSEPERSIPAFDASVAVRNARVDEDINIDRDMDI